MIKDIFCRLLKYPMHACAAVIALFMFMSCKATFALAEGRGSSHTFLGFMALQFAKIEDEKNI